MRCRSWNGDECEDVCADLDAGAMNVWMYAPVLGDSTSNGRDTEIPENLVEIPRWDLVTKTR